MVLPELAGVSPLDLATVSPSGLALVEDKINLVITTLNDEIDLLHEVDFPTNGHIAKGSFGGGERSPLLALHHARAHGVVVTTLSDLRRDLVDFRSAIREAKQLIRDTDEQAESDVLRILQRTNDLDLGQNALPEAQQQHRNDTATDQPVAAGEGS